MKLNCQWLEPTTSFIVPYIKGQLQQVLNVDVNNIAVKTQTHTFSLLLSYFLLKYMYQTIRQLQQEGHCKP